MVIIGVVAASVDDISVGVAACDGGGGDCDGVDCDVLVDVGGGGGGGGGGVGGNVGAGVGAALVVVGRGLAVAIGGCAPQLRADASHVLVPPDKYTD